jgi:hypothetical protein
VIRKEDGNKIKPTEFYLYQTPVQIAIKIFHMLVQLKFFFRSLQVIKRDIKLRGPHTISNKLVLLRALKPSTFIHVYQRLENTVVQISGSEWQAIGRIFQKSVTQSDTTRASEHNTLRKYEQFFDLHSFTLSPYL